MNVIKHTRFVWELENFIDDEELTYFNDLVDFLKPTIAPEWRNPQRDNNTCDLSLNPDHAELDLMASQWVDKAHRYYVQNNKKVFYNWKDRPLDDYSIAHSWAGTTILRTYDPSDTYHWHTDHSPNEIAEYSYIIYLNDDFEGGETQFKYDNITVSPKRASVLCFPVDNYHLHRGLEVKSGHKRIIWNCLYRWKIMRTCPEILRTQRRASTSIW